MCWRTRYVHFVNEIYIISSLSGSENISILRSKNIEQSQIAYRQKKNELLSTKSSFFYGWGIGIRIIHSQCEWDIRIVLFAKNDILYRFLNAQTLAGSNPKPIHEKIKRQVFDLPSCFYGWGIGIRTPTNRVRVCRATVTLFPNGKRNYISTSSNCQEFLDKNFKYFLFFCFMFLISIHF